MGISTITITLDLYSHVTGTMQDAATQLDKAFRAAMTGKHEVRVSIAISVASTVVNARDFEMDGWPSG